MPTRTAREAKRLAEIEAMLSQYGLAIVALAVLLDQLGVPIPAPPTLVLAGGLVGKGVLDPGATFVVATLACLPADLAWFEIGRRKGRRVLRLLCRISLEPDSCVRMTAERFARRGPMTLLFAKFLPGVQTIAPPLAGASGLSQPRFLAYDVPGAALWSAVFLVAGALLHGQIDRFLEAFAAVGGRVGLSLGLLVSAWIGWKYRNRQRLLKLLRTARIEPRELRSLFDREPPPALFDLRHPDQIDLDGGRIPGAVALPLADVEARHHEIPRDREIILYCT